jgi:hypothetical protein
LALDWSILNTNQPVDIAGNFARGFQVGQALMDKFHERNALAALAQTPNDPAALATLYQVNPTLGAHFEERGQQLATAQRRAAIGTEYATDPAGARQAAVASGDFDLADQLSKLDDTKQKQAVDFWQKAGPIAYALKQKTDPAQRLALWQQAKPILQSEGVDTTALNQFDPTNDAQLDAAITMSQKVSDLINQGKIEWHAVPGDGGSMFATDTMGRPVGANNPYANGAISASAPANDAAKLNPAQAWQFIGPHEGGYSAHDGNGAPVNFGINQAANPDVDVSKLTPDQAQQLFEKRYWEPSGAANLPAPLAAVHADTYFISPAKATQFLQESGGDPQKYMDLRQAWMQQLAAAPKYARFASAWANRNNDLREFASELGGGHGASSGVQVVSSKAEFDALPSGTMFIAPDGSKRVKP